MGAEQPSLLFLVSVVERDGDCGLGHSCLSILVDELLEVGGPNVAEVGDTQQEADGVKDVALPRPAENRDRCVIMIQV